jgi:hypothetical protein
MGAPSFARFLREGWDSNAINLPSVISSELDGPAFAAVRSNAEKRSPRLDSEMWDAEITDFN